MCCKGFKKKKKSELPSHVKQVDAIRLINIDTLRWSHCGLGWGITLYKGEAGNCLRKKVDNWFWFRLVLGDKKGKLKCNYDGCHFRSQYNYRYFQCSIKRIRHTMSASLLPLFLKWHLTETKHAYLPQRGKLMIETIGEQWRDKSFSSSSRCIPKIGFNKLGRCWWWTLLMCICLHRLIRDFPTPLFRLAHNQNHYTLGEKKKAIVLVLNCKMCHTVWACHCWRISSRTSIISGGKIKPYLTCPILGSIVELTTLV